MSNNIDNASSFIRRQPRQIRRQPRQIRRQPRQPRRPRRRVELLPKAPLPGSYNRTHRRHESNMSVASRDPQMWGILITASIRLSNGKIYIDKHSPSAVLVLVPL